MKTAMQELKTQLESKANDPMCIQIESDIFKRVSNLIDIYLPKEKQQIIEAYDNGMAYQYTDSDHYAEDYYNETFEQ
jgi:hypothetical protein